MTITEPQLRAFLPALAGSAGWVAALNAACPRFEITTPARLAAFLAQTAHESNGYTALVENLNYSATGLMKTWPKRFPTLEVARQYERQPQKIASRVYANRNGNGPDVVSDPASSDGWRFRGRGLVQLTFRGNYRSTGEALRLPLETEPEQLLQPSVATLSAAHYWQSRGLNPLADPNTVEGFDQITRKINGGTHGLVERRVRWEQAKAALRV